MISLSLARQRLSQQRLAADPLSTPAEVVAWMGAVQAQDYPGAKWALGLRMQAATEAAIDQAFNEGVILRTHVLRPTWHFVAPADIRWMLALTRPRVIRSVAAYFRQNELDDALIARCEEILASALRGGRQLTRVELGSALSAVGIPTNGLRLLLIVMRAELDGLICSGPRRGKQFTYMLIDERVPPEPVLAREEALAELTRRYFTGHGPATANDFAWWSGLTLADVRTGLDLAAAHLESIVIDGQTCWFPVSGITPAPDGDAGGALLLPTYDEFLVGFSAFGETRNGGRLDPEEDNFAATILVDGRVAGRWRRTLKKSAVTVKLAPFAPLSLEETASLSAAADHYGAFLGLPVNLDLIEKSSFVQ